MVVKCIVIDPFTLEEFKKLKNIQRYNETHNKEGKLYLNDIFECDTKMANYLLKDNKNHKAYIKVIEIKKKGE